MTLPRLHLSAVAAAAIYAASALNSPAALLVYEPFNYPSTQGADINNDGKVDVLGLGGLELGLAGTWFEPATSVGEDPATTPLDGMLSGSIPAPAGSAVLVPSGNSIQAIARYPNPYGPSPAAYTQGQSVLSRELVSPILGASNSTIWLSFLVRRDAPGYLPGGSESDADSFVFRLKSQTVAEGQRSLFEVGDYDAGQTYGVGGIIGQNYTWVPSSTPATNTGESVFLVAKISFGLAGDTVELFINPTPSEGAPTSPSASLAGLDIPQINMVEIEMSGRNRQLWSFDELRIGQEWKDVAAVPEPGSGTALIVALGIASMGRFRRKG